MMQDEMTIEYSAAKDVSGLALFFFRVRSYLFNIYLVLITLVIGLLGLPILTLGRKTSLAACQFWARTILFGLRWICGISSQVSGREKLPQGGAIIASNHQSMWETMQIYCVLSNPVMVLKTELLKIPLFGLWLKASGCIAVDRTAGAKALRSLVERAGEAAGNGGQIIIFPEGTRGQPGEIKGLKPGIAGIYKMANVPCVPIGHNSGTYWHFPSGLKVSGMITMNIGPSIRPGLQKSEFMKDLKNRLLDLRPDISLNETIDIFSEEKNISS